MEEKSRKIMMPLEGALGWKILFGDEYELMPDPNLPENTAFLNALKKKRKEEFRNLREGAGKVLFEEWSNRIKIAMLVTMLAPEEELCNCSICQKIKSVQVLLTAMIEVEKVLQEPKI